MERKRLERGTLASPSDEDEQDEPAAQSALAPAGSSPTATAPERIRERYQVRETLGRGGMAVVYRVFDAQDGRELALKQLLPQREQGDAHKVAALFEREYHTLAQLTHPRVIEVYDFGVEAGRAYYTMELLDGGDLRERCPLTWRDACRLMFDVCSSLALLHSRRLVHRDISPRNVR
jgi:serine/threonine-protein kinase